MIIAHPLHFLEAPFIYTWIFPTSLFLGYYIYTEATLGNKKDSTHLVSPTVKYINSTSCLSFWYHMFGNHIGTLEVHKQINGGNKQRLFMLSGYQGHIWSQAQVQIISDSRPFHLLFGAHRGDGYQGDMAIDDVMLRNGSCDIPGKVLFKSRYVSCYIQELLHYSL